MSRDALEDQILARADRIGSRVSREIRRVWAHLLSAIRASATFVDARVRVYPILRGLAPVVSRALIDGLVDQMGWAHGREAILLGRQISRPALLRLIARRQGKSLSEAFSWDDLLAPLREPRLDTDVNDADIEMPDLLRLLFPPVSPMRAHEIVFSSNWMARLSAATRLAAPEVLATQIATGVMLGHTWQEIAKEILPTVQGVQVSARRIARTEGLRVAHTVQMDAHAGLGDLVIGYRINATLDSNTRPEHRVRDGTIYYAEPKPGQKGYDQMPRPPMEADGTIAHNCRCYLSPVLRD